MAEQKTEVKTSSGQALKAGIFGSLGVGIGGIVVIVVVILVILGICIGCCIFSGVLTTLSGGDSNTTIETEENAKENAAKIKEFVTTKNVEWRVDKVENLGKTIKSDNMFIEDGTTSGKFIKVTYTIKNNDTSAVSPAKPKILDDKGREYNNWDREYEFLSDAAFLEGINPGISKAFPSIFDVPPDAKGLKLQIRGGGLFDEEIKYIDLGI